LESDIAPFTTMSQDPEVMRYFPNTLTKEEVQITIENFKKHYNDFGYTYFAMDELATGTFIGFTGLKLQTFESKYTPSVDIGWRLARSAWGKGYATEAASICLKAAFNEFGLTEVYSYCPDLNKGSESIMKKIGMEFIGTFMHPKVAGDSRFKHCVVYKKSKA
ncbi:MAG: GNAT family N-acetyltransferase, partial [Flavobacteriaceae bacterium]|nr:GNAT family N-acetyltransferase [Flavobacteriaceae bacterium]